ncbi:hypothetical protein LTR53_012541 [Teratosphaeriaceae sp. CCFEE 6253]|nr:hypothetical protein LTR53_012541 [Teratosphaeriaceae sp. CCFEE 6253]
MPDITSLLEPQAIPPPKPRRRHAADNLPESLLLTARATEKTAFDPATHLTFTPPRKILTFEDLGQSDAGISPNAVSEPFALFTDEAVKQMRAEIFSPEILARHYCPTSPSSGQVRGHCPNDAKFINAVWTCPQVLEIISQVAGIELVPAMDYDIGHTNISINSDDSEYACVAPGEAKDASSDFCESAFGWHRDSYPFVVVTMLSDCEGMVGGETAIRTGAGEVIKARGPALVSHGSTSLLSSIPNRPLTHIEQGTAVVMQGRYVDHQATIALGGRERISMVTSFRPRSHLVRDETTLRGVRNISDISTLYYQYSEYRLRNLERRVQDERESLRLRREGGGGFDVPRARSWLGEQRGLLDAMLSEMQVY